MAMEVLLIQGAGEGAYAEDAKLAESVRKELGPDYEVRYPAMPNEADPDDDAWRDRIAAELADMGENAILVGHSAGAATLCSFLATRDLERRVAGIFLIAAPFFGEGGWQVEGFTMPEDFGRRFPDAPVFLYHGSKDEIAPIAHLDLYARAIPHAVVRRLEGRNHQLNDDMTEVARDIEKLDRLRIANVLEEYARDAQHLVQSFEGISSSDVYAHVAHLLPTRPARFIDVGAGTGRDAAWLAAQGHSVLAIEPTDHLRVTGMQLHPSRQITWLSDTLPDLERTRARGETFDRVVVCAVWQHLSARERARAMPNLTRLLAPDGLLIMILRHEPDDPRRPGDTQRTDAENLARACGLRLTFARKGKPISPNSARGVTLTWLAFAAAKVSPVDSESI